MRRLLVMLALAVSPSIAAAADFAGEVGTAVEALPDLYGSSYARARHEVVIEATTDGGLTLLGAGNVHHAPLVGADGATSVTPDESDLQRLTVEYRGNNDLVLSAGRFVDTTSGGPARIDGAAVHTGSLLPVELRAWGGRLGHVEPTEPTGAWAGGGDLGWSGTGLGATGGATLVQDSDLRDLRAGGRGSVWGPRGAHGDISVEYGWQTALVDSTQESGARAGLALRVPVNAALTVDGGARWNGLAPIWLPPTALGAIEALAPAGYAVGDVGLTARIGETVLRAAGGPTWLADDGSYGLTGRLSSEVRSVPGNPGLFFATSAIGQSWYAGGGIGGGDTFGPANLGLDAGLFRVQTLDSSVAWVGEGRVHLGWAVWSDSSRTPLRVEVEAAAGTDRLLSPWYRGGLALRGELGKERS